MQRIDDNSYSTDRPDGRSPRAGGSDEPSGGSRPLDAGYDTGTPNIDWDEDGDAGWRNVQYDDTPAGSYCVSGPLIDSRGRQLSDGPGTPRTREEARRWAQETFGDRLVREERGPGPRPTRWCVRVMPAAAPGRELPL